MHNVQTEIVKAFLKNDRSSSFLRNEEEVRLSIDALLTEKEADFAELLGLVLLYIFNNDVSKISTDIIAQFTAVLNVGRWKILNERPRSDQEARWRSYARDMSQKYDLANEKEFSKLNIVQRTLILNFLNVIYSILDISGFENDWTGAIEYFSSNGEDDGE